MSYTPHMHLRKLAQVLYLIYSGYMHITLPSTLFFFYPTYMQINDKPSYFQIAKDLLVFASLIIISSFFSSYPNIMLRFMLGWQSNIGPVLSIYRQEKVNINLLLGYLKILLESNMLVQVCNSSIDSLLSSMWREREYIIRMIWKL